jgi:hypothetical protein
LTLRINFVKAPGMAKPRNLLSWLLLAALAASCSDDDGGGETVLPDGPLYLVGTRFWDDSSITSYFQVVPSLAAGQSVDLARAIEVPGAAKLMAYADLGWFAVGDGESPIITRYTLDDAGRLVKGAQLSLQPAGVGGLWDTLYFVSETKAYYPDREGQQLVVWNPTAMELVGTIALPETAREGFLANYGYAAIQRGDFLLFPVGWFDWSDNDAILPETGLVVVDTRTDTVARVDVDTRCGGITQVVEVGGDAILVSSALAAAAHTLGRLPTAPCALKVAAGDDHIDPADLQPLAELTDGALAGEPMPAGDGGIFLRVLDAELAEMPEGQRTYELTGQAAWRWARWDVASGALEPMTTLPPSTADVIWFAVDGHV